MTNAQKAAEYDRLITLIAAELQRQKWGTPEWRSWDQLKDDRDAALANYLAAQEALAQVQVARDEAQANYLGCKNDLAACEAKLPPDPPPTTGWKQRKTLAKRADWKAVLIENFKGATITDRQGGGLDFWIPNAQSVGGSSRVEVQDAPLGTEGEELAYEWTFRIPKLTVLSTTADKENLIQQGHGNQQAGFTSGVAIMQPDERIKVKVKGGHETSTAGSHRYEYEDEFYFGQVKRDTWHRVRLEVLWHRSAGYFTASLDGGEQVGKLNVPTWPLGDKDGNPTEHIMGRLGWYPSAGRTYGPMLMETGPLLIQEAA